ncbi:MAG: cold shock domain-containing protein [Bacteroidota bacterium]
MGRSSETFSKKEKTKKRLKKRQDKLKKREERRQNSPGGGLEAMLAYVDEFGNIVETPPDPNKKTKVKAENIEISVPKKEEFEGPSVLRGRLEYYNEAKGFGFIKDLDSQEKYFTHVNGWLEDLKESDIVTFELVQGRKGLNAVEVQRAQ